ncbi:hypothetical protein MN116_000972 [Schistosoma mekongi]|uniref:Uncharacterized protein n=1 Tax=Schistosoma mekongi TaxID=38744 RepID=A0AAE2D971_SCHME|nr:hypothetical protein MN116_000972 [Schistosoma mekongi]
MSIMITSNSYRLDHVLLRRGLSTASALIQPKVTEKQRRTVDSCCAIEVTSDRLSYAALCLDPENKNSVILSSWNSLSLNLPSGREFRPSVCSSMAYNCSNIIKNNILSNNFGKYTDIILRPIIPSTSFPINHKLNNHNIHQAVITGYLLAFLSYNIDNTPTNRFNISTNCPTNEILVKWINQPTSHWTILLNHQIFNKPTNIVFSLLPINSKYDLTKHSVSTTLNNNNDTLEMIYLQVTSSQLYTIYKCTNLMNQKDITTVQFLLARCLFTCMYYLLQDKYSMITKSMMNYYLK